MFLALDPDEQAISDAAADFLVNEFPLERLHKVPRDISKLEAFAELGWLGLAAPESAGGSGLTIVEEMLFFIQNGRVAGPLEILIQVLAIAAAQSAPAVSESLICGKAGVALLVEQAADRIRLIGNADARYALAVSPRCASLFELNLANCQSVMCLDSSVAMYTGDGTMIRPVLEQAGGAVWQQAQIDVSAMQLGLAERALEMIVGYAKQRQTFGRAIGAYQAVRHPCADMAVRVETARSQLFYAATAFKEGHEDAVMQTDGARLLADRAAKLNTDTNIQLHGGIGVTDEHSAHLLLKRANLLGRLFGTSRQHMASLLDVAGMPREA